MYPCVITLDLELTILVPEYSIMFYILYFGYFRPFSIFILVM